MADLLSHVCYQASNQIKATLVSANQLILNKIFHTPVRQTKVKAHFQFNNHFMWVKGMYSGWTLHMREMYRVQIAVWGHTNWRYITLCTLHCLLSSLQEPSKCLFIWKFTVDVWCENVEWCPQPEALTVISLCQDLYILVLCRIRDSAKFPRCTNFCVQPC